MLVSKTSKIRPNNVRAISLAKGKTVQICEYGAYPQTIASLDISAKLEAEYQNNSPKKTGKSYTFDSADLNDFDSGFIPKNCIEYMFGGKRYVRVEGKRASENSIMSDGTEVEDGKPYWFEVEPIEWLMDEKTGIWRAKKGLIAGIQFDNKDDYDGDFEKINMCHYLNTYFAKKMEWEFTETMSRLAIRNHYFSNYVSGMGDNKTFYPEGKDGNRFTPAKAQEIIDLTNAPPFMRDVLKLIAAFPKEEQRQFKEQVLNVFDKARHPYDQPNEVWIWGKKLAVSGGYEKELNDAIGITSTAENSENKAAVEPSSYSSNPITEVSPTLQSKTSASNETAPEPQTVSEISPKEEKQTPKTAPESMKNIFAKWLADRFR